jgi:hypothetical protein
MRGGVVDNHRQTFACQPAFGLARLKKLPLMLPFNHRDAKR